MFREYYHGLLGYLWDAAIRAKLSVRNYGFFLDLAGC
jgi:hypothetical protein